MNFDRMMTIYLYKSAQILLLFYCLTPTDIECSYLGVTEERKPEVIKFKKNHSPDSYALIKRFDNQRESPTCGAVWFSDHFLLTSASCLTRNYDLTRAPYIEVTVLKWTAEKEKDLPKKKNLLKKLQDKLRGQKKSDQSIANAAQIDVPPKGEAIVHPLYKMNEDGLSFGYDLAVVRVNVAGRKTAKLCSKDSTASRWILFTRVFSRDFFEHYQYHVYRQIQRNFIAFANNGRTMQWYRIDPHKQFTTYSENPDFYPRKDGDPIFDFKKNCVAGIKNFGGSIDKETKFITSTKVYPVKEWIEHTRQYLINLNKEHPQTVGPLNADKRQPGNILTDADIKQLPDVTPEPIKWTGKSEHQEMLWKLRSSTSQPT